MANEEHVKILKQGVEAWNEWREEQPDVRVNLLGAFLLRANLFRANLSEANLFRADLFGADLSEANLSRAILIKADLSEADLSGAILLSANLRGVNLYAAKNLTQEQIESAITDEDTKLPDDLK